MGGNHFGGPNEKDRSILGSVLGSVLGFPYFWKLPNTGH